MIIGPARKLEEKLILSQSVDNGKVLDEEWIELIQNAIYMEMQIYGIGNFFSNKQ
ncbi:hypothetical protein MGI18_14230 [Bacillus sp. OVS6]|nr:hypothetical protein MGI18_14230 [Bacillus sp. OVS6]